MTYNPESQFRCTIIRGKAKTDLDNLLPAYAKIVEEICPIGFQEFPERFNMELSKHIPESTKKTLDNHRTEIAGKLFGLYFIDRDGVVRCSERTLAFLGNNDQPFFFKDICFKFQFPNGMDSVNTIQEKMNNGVRIRQFSYLLQLMLLAMNVGKALTKDEIGYYVLNSLDALRGNVTPSEVLERIFSDRERKIQNKVYYEGKASSYSFQHINEQLNLMELANLVRIFSGSVVLNKMEMEAIQYIASYWDKPLGFDIYMYSLESVDDRNKMYREWESYYSRVSEGALVKFITRVEALGYEPEIGTGEEILKTRMGLIELGDEGEIYVYNYEKERVSRFNKRLVNKVKLFGKIKGLGYDIQTIVAEGENAEFVRYLEVKSTKRVTAPRLDENGWTETLNLTRNEWVAAQQHRQAFFIYRVYFTGVGVIVYALMDPYGKNEDGRIRVTPVNYRLDFSSLAVDYQFQSDKNEKE